MPEYVNPLSLIQQGQPAGRDMSLPGAGWGLLQGYQDAVARNQAQDLLSASSQAMGMDMANKMQEHLRYASETPLMLQGKQLQNEGMGLQNIGQQQTNTMNKQKIDANEEEARTERLAFMAFHSDTLRDTATKKGPLAAQEYLANLRRLYKNKFQSDPDPMFNSYTPETQMVFDQAKSVYDYDIKHRQQLFMQDRKIQGAKDIQESENENRLDIAKLDAKTRIEVAKLNAEAHKLTSQRKADLDNEYMEAAALPENQRTDKQKALIARWPSLRAASPELKQSALTEGEVERLRRQMEEVEKWGEKKDKPPKHERIQFKDSKELPMGDKATPGQEAIDADGNVYRYGTMGGLRGWHPIPSED